jgi:hypothetical protein
VTHSSISYPEVHRPGLPGKLLKLCISAQGNAKTYRIHTATRDHKDFLHQPRLLLHLFSINNTPKVESKAVREPDLNFNQYDIDSDLIDTEAAFNFGMD